MAVNERAQQWWAHLSPTQRKVVVALGIVDTVLKGVALRDLRRRPKDQVNGNKLAWGLALSTVNSAGVLPLCYLTLGRQV